MPSGSIKKHSVNSKSSLSNSTRMLSGKSIVSSSVRMPLRSNSVRKPSDSNRKKPKPPK